MSNLTGGALLAAKEGVAATLGHEGGEVNNKHDAGGYTKFGVTPAALKTRAHKSQKTVAQKYGVAGVAEVTLEIARKIYIGEYYIPSAAPKIYDACRAKSSHKQAALVANFHFDCAINHGIGAAVKILQEALNLTNRRDTLWNDIKVDGGFGAKTLKTLNTCLRRKGAARLLGVMLALRSSKFIAITRARKQNEEFLDGWLARLTVFYEKYLSVFRQ